MKRPAELPLDEIVVCGREVQNWGKVWFYGVVDAVEMGDPPINYLARVRVLRILPELFVPPEPGALVERANLKAQEIALHFDGMKREAGLRQRGFSHRAKGRARQYRGDFRSGHQDELLLVLALQPVSQPSPGPAARHCL